MICCLSVTDNDAVNSENNDRCPIERFNSMSSRDVVDESNFTPSMRDIASATCSAPGSHPRCDFRTSPALENKSQYAGGIVLPPCSQVNTNTELSRPVPALFDFSARLIGFRFMGSTSLQPANTGKDRRTQHVSHVGLCHTPEYFPPVGEPMAPVK